MFAQPTSRNLIKGGDFLKRFGTAAMLLPTVGIHKCEHHTYGIEQISRLGDFKDNTSSDSNYILIVRRQMTLLLWSKQYKKRAS